MGLFDIFSSTPPPLEEKYSRYLSSHFSIDKINKDEYNTGMKKLAEVQSKLSEALEKDEDIIVISPSYPRSSPVWFYSGIVIVTNQRVMHFDGKLKGEIPLSEIADIERMVYPVGGHFGATIISKTALPYATFKLEQNNAGDNYRLNVLNILLSTTELRDEFHAVIEIAKTNMTSMHTE